MVLDNIYFLWLVPFGSIYHARVFTPRQNCFSINLISNGLTQPITQIQTYSITLTNTLNINI